MRQCVVAFFFYRFLYIYLCTGYTYTYEWPICIPQGSRDTVGLAWHRPLNNGNTLADFAKVVPGAEPHNVQAIDNCYDSPHRLCFYIRVSEDKITASFLYVPYALRTHRPPHRQPTMGIRRTIHCPTNNDPDRWRLPEYPENPVAPDQIVRNGRSSRASVNQLKQSPRRIKILESFIAPDYRCARPSGRRTVPIRPVAMDCGVSVSCGRF